MHSMALRLVKGAVVIAAVGVFALAAQPASATHGPPVPYVTGDVFAGIGNGKINHFSPTGVLKHQLNTTSGSTEDTGMCFDQTGNLYSTNFQAGNMTKFDTGGNRLVHPWATGFVLRPESCARDASGNIYVGSVDPGDLRQYTTAGTLVDTDNPLPGPRGIDWIDLAADQCTMYYTSEGPDIRRFNACTDTQLTNFALVAGSRCFALRIRPNGEVLVACTSQVVRLSPLGVIMQVYPAATLTPSASFLFALNLDPDGTSFWTADIGTGRIYRIDIATGNQIISFDGMRETTLAGLAVFGEPTAGGGDGQCPPDDDDDNGGDDNGRGDDDEDDDNDGLTNKNENRLLTLLENRDSDLDGIVDGNDDANGNGEDDEDEDDDECPDDDDSDGDGVDDEDEDDDDDDGDD